MKKRCSFVDFQSAVMAPGLLTGVKTLNSTRDVNVTMHVGIDPGFLTVNVTNNSGEVQEILIPLMNVKAVVVIPEKDPKAK